MKRKTVLYTLAVLLVGGSALWLGPSVLAKNRQDGKRKPTPTRPIPTTRVQPLTKHLTREFPGKVRASQRVQLAFSVPGLLEDLNALEGRVVRKGEVIARLDQRDYRNALDVAKASYIDAKQSFERTQALRENKVVAEAEFDRAKAAFDMAAANLRIREKALADTVLEAPFDGIVVTRYSENYEHIQAKQPIVSIQNISVVEIVLQVPERLVARDGAKSLQSIAVHIDADGGRWFEASILEFSAQADPVTRTYELVLGMEPPADMKVLPGMTATVRATVPRHDPVENWTESLTLVPAGALVNAPSGESYVWIIGDEPGTPRKAVVTVGEPREEGIEIRSGLEPGQRIATAGVHSIDESTPVRPMREGGEGLDG